MDTFCACGHKLRTIEDIDSGVCVRCRIKAKLAESERKHWNSATVIEGLGVRTTFDGHETYEENYIDALEYMMFFARIANRDAWRLIRGK